MAYCRLCARNLAFVWARWTEGSTVVMVYPECVHVRHNECTIGDGVIATLEKAIVDKCIAQQHDLLAHAILVLEIDDRSRVPVR